MITRTVVLKMCAVMLLMAELFASGSHAAELKLLFKDEAGKSVTISKAELLLVAWGYTERLTLETQGTALSLPLDGSWLRSRASERFRDLDGVYLYLQASGFAPIRTDRFTWPGSGPEPASGARIQFPGAQELVIPRDGVATSKITFRRPQKKFIRFIDDENKPFPDVKASISVFWSDSNHCGRLAVADSLTKSTSDGNGLIAVPDGDVEYVVEIGSRVAVFKDPGNSAFPDRLRLHMNSAIADVPLHRRAMKPLMLQVVHDGAPATGEMLFTCLQDCREGSCGSCCGFLQKTDGRGMISLTDFYPEMYGRIFFARPDAKVPLQEATPLWEMKPPAYPPNAVIKVDLK